MSDRDLAQLAARTLREAHDGQRAGAGFTKARIVKTMHDRRRRRRAAWVVVGPLFAVFVGSTAWAQVTGHWPVWVEQAVLLFTAEKVSVPAETAAADEPRLPKKRALGKSLSAAEVVEESVAKLAEPSPEETAAEADSVATAEPAVVAAAQPQGRIARPRVSRVVEGSSDVDGAMRTESLVPPDEVQSASPSSEALESESAKAPLEADPEFRAFREGHDQHYRANDPSAAIAAYRRYLESYPRGRFVPEARYNIALNSLRLGRQAEANRILTMFADGRYGTYRQAEAKALLDAIK